MENRSIPTKKWLRGRNPNIGARLTNNLTESYFNRLETVGNTTETVNKKNEIFLSQETLKQIIGLIQASKYSHGLVK